jgi:hypothetical protein
VIGREVAIRLAENPKALLVSPEVLEIVGEVDLTILNLECCIQAANADG